MSRLPYTRCCWFAVTWTRLQTLIASRGALLSAIILNASVTPAACSPSSLPSEPNDHQIKHPVLTSVTNVMSCRRSGAVEDGCSDNLLSTAIDSPYHVQPSSDRIASRHLFAVLNALHAV